MVGNLLLRGMIAGMIAGILVFAFARVFGEPLVDFQGVLRGVPLILSGEGAAASAAAAARGE